MTAAPHFISHAPRDLAHWVGLFDPGQLPVLASTAEALELMRCNEETVDAHLIAEAIASDPLMTMKLLTHVAKLRRGREGGETETVIEALVMLGVTPFFTAFSAQETVEDRLAAHPGALQGFRKVLSRSRRAAQFAISFAVHRMDYDAPVIYQAAMLHDFAELLLWLRAPALAQQLAERQHADPQLRSAAVQRELLHVELADLEHALMLAWCLPALLVHITDDSARNVSSQMRNVQLAIRVARHSAQGWDNPALPDDLEDIGQLLCIAPEAAGRLVQEIDLDQAILQS